MPACEKGPTRWRGHCDRCKSTKGNKAAEDKKVDEEEIMEAYSRSPAARSLAADEDEEGLEALHPLPLATKESDPLYKV